MGLHANDILPSGHRLHWYEIQSLLGFGGFGITYLGRDMNLNQSVAIKEFFPQNYVQRKSDFTIEPGDGINREYYYWGMERFLEEARTLARFRHPNIVRVLSVFEDFGTAYMIMELERGYSLGEAIRLGHVNNEAIILDVAVSMLGGLRLIHQAGFIHRDIKPGNILLREDQSLVLIDFGSARQPHPQETENLTAIVSKGYAPFEQYDAGNEEQQGPWSDIYGLAATLYHAVTCSAPVDSMTRAMALLNNAEDPLVPASRKARGLYSEKLLNAIDAGLIVRASERPQDTASWLLMFPEHVPESRNRPQVRTEALNIPHLRDAIKRRQNRTPPSSISTVIISPSRLPGAAIQQPEATTKDNPLIPAGPGTLVKPGGPDKATPETCAGWSYLVVDDELSCRNLASRVLSRLGAKKIKTVENAQLALDAVNSDPPPDVILCDLVMPQTDGVLLLRHLAEAQARSGIILVGDGDSRLLSAAEGIARGHRLHVLGSLNKPLVPNALGELLHQMQTYREHTAKEQLASDVSDHELRELVESGSGLELVYLPTISIKDRSLIGAEALSRLPGVMQGSDSVLRTITRIEALGLADKFSAQVFGQALAQAGAWHGEGMQFGISINVFAGMLNELQLPDQVVGMAQAEGLDPSCVTLEVNEPRFEDECAAPMEILTRLRLRKVNLSFDDFGTGSSTFERLRQLPVTEIKVDRSIIQSAADDITSRVILESCVALARRLDLRVVAIGVEDEQTLELVTNVGCDAAQGYHISKPLSGESLMDWASDWQSGHSFRSASTVVADNVERLD